MMMSQAFTHTATRRRSPLFGFRVARESVLPANVVWYCTWLNVYCHYPFPCNCLSSVVPLYAPGAPVGWAISIQATEAISTCLKRANIRTVLSLEPRFLRSSRFGASETCSGIRGVLFTLSTKLATVSYHEPWPLQVYSLTAATLCPSSTPNCILIPIAAIAVVTSFEAN